MNSKPETLAGIFAVKESCKKIFNNLDWLDIEVKKKRNGKPVLMLNDTEQKQKPRYKTGSFGDNKINNTIDYDLSISHDNNYAVAIFLVEDK